MVTNCMWVVKIIKQDWPIALQEFKKLVKLIIILITFTNY